MNELRIKHERGSELIIQHFPESARLAVEIRDWKGRTIPMILTRRETQKLARWLIEEFGEYVQREIYDMRRAIIELDAALDFWKRVAEEYKELSEEMLGPEDGEITYSV